MLEYHYNIFSVSILLFTKKIYIYIHIYSHAATLQKRSERDVFFMTTQSIVQLVQRYRNGIRGRMKSTVHELLRQYYAVESHFQYGRIYIFNLFLLFFSFTFFNIIFISLYQKYAF